ncbi:unnamed protein product [Vitrella brassicaformis CCMP3155]|uniref:Uncharacterized protein n=1 Tax=Vitrella brassicaformis (strain CCMP3155) TaxID=1169540 RepID=A0A0G4FQB5_VITBC|nr:unnamed protein product [Vitrella brassicaformis CCMP3155]|eukprot:CEM16026.1 unnamed protein product [Vitrella brassicaformis CCMP3155]
MTFSSPLSSCASALQRAMKRVHPGQLKDFILLMRDIYGAPFVTLLTSVFLAVKGILWSFIWLGQLPYYKEIGIDGSSYQTLFFVALMPWAMKGLFGVMSDVQPLFGYHKRPYLVIGAISATAAALLLAVLPRDVARATPQIGALGFFFVSVGVAIIDLLVEAKYAEIMRQKHLAALAGGTPQLAVKDRTDGPVPSEIETVTATPQSVEGSTAVEVADSEGDSTDKDPASKVVTYVWMCTIVGWFLASCMIGPIADNFSVQLVFCVGPFLAAQVLIPILKGYLPETRLPPGEANKFQRDKFQKGKAVFGLAFATAVVALALALAGLVGPPETKLAVAVGGSLILLPLAFRVLPWRLACVNVYLFVSGATDYWYTAGPECVPGGPHFTYTYYQSFAHIVSTFGCMLGLFFFHSFIRNWRMRKAFWATTIIKTAACSLDIFILLRWNVRVGIPDKVAFIFGDAMLPSIVWLMEYMPGQLLVSKLAPPDMESTTFAILEGFRMFGSTVSRAVGVYVINQAGIKTTPPGCDFSALPLLVVICHMALPLIAIPLTFVLIPNKYFHDPLVDVAKPPPAADETQESSSGKIEMAAGTDATTHDKGDAEVKEYARADSVLTISTTHTRQVACGGGEEEGERDREGESCVDVDISSSAESSSHAPTSTPTPAG